MTESSENTPQSVALDWLLRLKASPDDRHLQQSFEQWLQADEQHRRAWRKAEKVWQLTGALPASMDLGNRPEPRAQQAAPRRSRRWRRPRLAIACSLLLGLLLTAGLERGPGHDVSTGTAQVRTLDLADGSHVQLDSQTALDIDLGPQRRYIRLVDGQAFFQVHRQPDAPFIVDTDALKVTVTGTAFEVRHLYQQTRVSVVEGSVQVDIDSQTQQAPFQLQAGDQLLFDQASSRVSLVRTPIEQIASWRTGKLLVEAATLDHVVREMRRHYNGLIILDPRLGRQKVTGTYNLGDPVSALQAALSPHNGQLQALGPYLLLLRKP